MHTFADAGSPWTNDTLTSVTDANTSSTIAATSAGIAARSASTLVDDLVSSVTTLHPGRWATSRQAEWRRRNSAATSVQSASVSG